MKNSYSSYRFIATLLLLITLGIGNMFADPDRGWWTTDAAYVGFRIDGSETSFDCNNINSDGVSDFELGNVDESLNLYFAWGKVWGQNLFNTVTIYYRVKVADAASDAAFSNYALTWRNDFPESGEGAKKNGYWDDTVDKSLTLTDLVAGNYEVEFYFVANGKDGNDYYLSNNGGNYHANFTLRRKVTYHDDGATSGTAPSAEYFSTSTATVRDNTGLLARTDNKVFAGWATSKANADAGTVAYDPAAGDEITSISANMNLYPVWKTGYYFISLAGRDANGTKNTTDFFTPKNLNDNTRRAVNGIEFSKSVFRLSKTPNDGDVVQNFEGTYIGNGKSFFAYDTKTTQTDISIYVYNDSTAAIPIYYRVLKEGSIQDVVSVEIPAESGKVVNIPTISHAKGTRVLFGAGDRGGTGYTKINFAQVRAIETGTAVPQAGQAGFELSVPGRFTTNSGEGTIDGLYGKSSTNVHIISGKNDNIPLSSSLDVEATQYVQFTTTGPMQLQLTPKSGKDNYQFYVKKDSKTRTASDVAHGAKNTTTSVNLPEAGTWYILGGTKNTTDNIYISKIAFVAAARITYNANGGSGSMSPTTCAAAENAFTAPTGYTFTGWNTASDGSGTPFAPGDDLFADAELFAQWEANFVIYRDGDRAGCTIPAADPVESYDGGTISQTIEYRMKVRALDQWYTLCLPFTVSAVQVWDDTDNAYYDLVPYYRIGGAFYTGHYIIRTPSAVTNLPIANFADWTDPESPTGYLPAKNTPYIIQWHDSYFLNKYICFFGERGQTIPTSMTTGTAPSSENVLNIHVNDAMKSGTITDAYLLDPEYGNGAWLREDIGTNRTIKPFECYILAASATKALYRIIRRDMTIVDTPTGFPTVTDTPLPVTAKVLIDGQLFIIREGKRYTIQGTLVK